jgi:hypothetical protein
MAEQLKCPVVQPTASGCLLLGEDTVHLPRRLVSPSDPAPSVQLALDLNSRRAGRLGPNHHLWRNGRLWWIAYTLLHDGWRQERVRHSLGTADVEEARRRRDLILGQWGSQEPLREELRIAS